MECSPLDIAKLSQSVIANGSACWNTEVTEPYLALSKESKLEADRVRKGAAMIHKADSGIRG